MLREVSQERVDKAMGACPVCQWPCGSRIIFCSSCGTQLACLEVSPKPVESLTFFEGFPVIMRFENTGKIPVELERLDGVEWGAWVSEANWPVSLDLGETIEIRRLHTESHGQRGRLILHSTVSPISFHYRVQKAPRIWLTDEQGREFDQGTDGVQLWPVNQEAQRHDLALHTTSEVVLEKPPRLSKGDQVVDIVPAEEVSYPFRVGPDKALSVRLTQNQPLSEEGHPVHLVFPIQNRGDVDFHLNLKYTLRPVIKVEFNPLSFSGDTALISGSRKQKNVSATITHLRGTPLRINVVTSDTSWLQVVDTRETPVILNSQNSTAGADKDKGSVLTLQLQINTIDIPRVARQTHFEPKIIVRGEAIGAEDSAFEERYSLSIAVIPPKPLDYPIGIDFGTTNSCLAYVVADEETMPRLAEFEINEPRVEVPTVFQLLATNKKTERLELSKPLEPNEHHLVVTEEEEAIMRFGRQPFHQMNDLWLNSDVNELWNSMSSICWSFKYALSQPDDQNIYISTGMSEGTLINGHPPINRRHISLTPVDQVAIYLRFMVEHFIGEFGYLPQEGVLTYPAVFNRQKQALQDAAEKALQDRDIKLHLAISEPEAIAVYYVKKQLDEGNMEDDMDEQIIGVFDCGGGTTDMSIVRYTMDNYEAQVEILGSDGDNRLGGNLLTFHLAKYFYEQLVPEQYRSRYPFAKDLRDGLRTQDTSVKRNFLHLYKLAEDIKTNSKAYELFDECFPQDRYEELIQTRSKGLLDLLASDEKLNWPKIELVSREEGDVFQVTEGLKRSINGDALPEELSSMDYLAIRSVLSQDLEWGFKKLAMMQQALFEREIISEFRLDHLILAGNSSKLPIMKEVARDMIQAKHFSNSTISSEAGSNNGLKASVASGAAIYSMSQRDPEFRLQVFGIHKLNYPIGSYNPMRGFSPIFNRWISLNKGKVHRYASRVSPNDRKIPRILLYEFFDWNYKNRKADRSKVADIPMPLENRAFEKAAYWQYKLELRADENNRGRLYYNFAVGQEEDGGDFEEIYDEYLECEDFNYS